MDEGFNPDKYNKIHSVQITEIPVKQRNFTLSHSFYTDNGPARAFASLPKEEII